MKEIEHLSVEEQLRLIGYLADRLQSTYLTQGRRLPITDFFGIAPNPDRSEDAQEWVSRMREESDERLERR